MMLTALKTEFPPASRRNAQRTGASLAFRFFRETWLYAAGFVSLFAVWHIVSVYIVRSILFPPPLPVFIRGMQLIENGTLVTQIGASLERIMIGFVLGSVLGIGIGLVMGSIRPIHKFLEPYVETLRFIPAVAMITVAVIWFGIGESSKIFIITYSTIFIVIITTAAGVSRIPPNKLNAGRSLGASGLQLFFFVTLPATVPSILTGMRVAMANAFTTIVAAEMIAANEGIGTFLWKARLYMLVDDTFVALVSLAILGFTIDRCFRWLANLFAGKYHA
jgi:NitT/TauT family transport system permease protein